MDHLLGIGAVKSIDEAEAKYNVNLTPKTLARKYSQLEKEIDSLFVKGKPALKIFGICGGSSCGKSKITKYFETRINKSVVIAERDFFKESKNSPRKRSFYEDKENMFAVSNDDDGYGRERKNKLIDLSNQDSYEWEKLVDILTSLKNNQAVVTPYYDYQNDVLHKMTNEVDPSQVSIIFLEGMFIYKIPEVRDLIDFKIFIEVDDDVRLSRMLIHENKYIKNNAPALKSFFIIYEKFIKICYEFNVEPTKKYAHLILPNFDITPDDEIEDNPSLEFLLANLQGMIKTRLLAMNRLENIKGN